MTDTLAAPLIETDEQFVEKIGPPILSFELPLDGDFEIPQGTETCCRVTHRPGCENYIAGTLVGCITTVRHTLHDCGHDNAPVPLQQAFINCGYMCLACPPRALEDRANRIQVDGDGLVDPSTVKAAVRLLVAGGMATAQALHTTVEKYEIHIWLLTEELAQDWERVIKLGQEMLDERMRLSDTMPSDQISSLPVNMLDPNDQDDARRMGEVGASGMFHPVEAYAERVMIVPGEVGHDNYARYVVQDIWDDGRLAALNAIVPEQDDTSPDRGIMTDEPPVPQVMASMGVDRIPGSR